MQKLIDESGTQPSPQDVEGAIGFVRASQDLRQRHGNAPAKPEQSSKEVGDSIP